MLVGLTDESQALPLSSLRESQDQANALLFQSRVLPLSPLYQTNPTPASAPELPNAPSTEVLSLLSPISSDHCCVDFSG